jgi:hypothetical protein
MLSAAVLVLCALAALVRGDSVPTLTFQVEPKKTICLYENLTPGQVTASWEVVRGGLLDINIAVCQTRKKRKTHEHNFNFCFDFFLCATFFFFFFFFFFVFVFFSLQITGPTGESYYKELYFEGRGTPGYKTFIANTGGRFSFCFDNESTSLCQQRRYLLTFFSFFFLLF